MAADRNDDEDTKEQPGAPRYPDAPGPGEQPPAGDAPAWPPTAPRDDRSPGAGSSLGTDPSSTGDSAPGSGPGSSPTSSSRSASPDPVDEGDRTVVWQQPPQGQWQGGSQAPQPQTPSSQWPAASSEQWPQNPGGQPWAGGPQQSNQGWGSPPSQQYGGPEFAGQPSQQPPYSGQPQYPGQQGYPGQPSGWGGQQTWGPPPGYAEYGSSPLVVLAGVILLVFGVLYLLFGGLAMAAGGFIEEIIQEAGPVPGLEGVTPRAIRDIVLVVGGIVLVIGLLQTISGIGIFLHKQWARVIGIALAALGTLLGVLSLVGAASARGTTGGGDLTFALILAVGYGFTLFALIAGGGHFTRRYRT